MATGQKPDTAWATILSDTRSELAAGRRVDRDALAARIRAVAPPQDADRAIAQLDRVLAVARAKARLAREPEPAPTPPVKARPLRSALKTRPMLTANMDVRRQNEGDARLLAWDAAAGVVEWEIRIAERADARSDYVTLSESRIPAEQTSLPLPLGKPALRVHLLGRARDGRLLRRAVISGLSAENWDERWQKRSSAA